MLPRLGQHPQLREHVLSTTGVRALMNQVDPTLSIQPGFWDHMGRALVRPEYRHVVNEVSVPSAKRHLAQRRPWRRHHVPAA